MWCHVAYCKKKQAVNVRGKLLRLLCLDWRNKEILRIFSQKLLCLNGWTYIQNTATCGKNKKIYWGDEGSGRRRRLRGEREWRLAGGSQRRLSCERGWMTGQQAAERAGEQTDEAGLWAKLETAGDELVMESWVMGRWWRAGSRAGKHKLRLKLGKQRLCREKYKSHSICDISYILSSWVLCKQD